MDDEKIIPIEKLVRRIKHKKAYPKMERTSSNSIDTIREFLPEIRQDVAKLLDIQKVIEALLNNICIKYVSSPGLSDALEAWLDSEEKIDALRFIRFVSQLEDSESQFVFENLELNEEEEALVRRWVESYGSVLDKVLDCAQQHADNKLNVWRNISCNLVGNTDHYTRISLKITTNWRTLRTVDSPSNILHLLVIVLNKVSKVLGQINLPESEISRLMQVVKNFESELEDLKRTVCGGN